MPVTYNSSTSSQVQISSGDPEASEDQVSQSSSTQVAMGDAPGGSEGETAVSAIADATAFGSDTLATVDGSVAVIDSGVATTTNVDLEALAVAQSADDLAFASTYVDTAYDGGGSYISIGHEFSSLEVENGETTAISVSQMALVAIELDENGFSSTSPPSDAAMNPEGAVPTAELPPEDICGCPDGGDGYLDIDLDGNLATFDLSVLAVDENSYADLVADAFAVEDAMSSVTVIITAIVE